MNIWQILLNPPHDLTEKLMPKRITSSEDELAASEKIRRENKICPTRDCGQKRILFVSGRYSPYCNDCARMKQREYRDSLKDLHLPENARRLKRHSNICCVPDCNEPRHVFKTGYKIARCKKHAEEIKYEQHMKRILRKSNDL